jgi:hypothetical protein
MADKPPDQIQALVSMVIEDRLRLAATQRATMVAHLATLTLLIDAKICTIEGACQRIEHIQKGLTAPYQDADVSARLGLITQWLRAHDKPDTDGTPASPRWTPVVIRGGLDQGDEPPDPTAPS